MIDSLDDQHLDNRHSTVYTSLILKRLVLTPWNIDITDTIFTRITMHITLNTKRWMVQYNEGHHHAIHSILRSLSLSQPYQALTPPCIVSLCHNHTKHSLHPAQSLSVTTIPSTHSILRSLSVITIPNIFQLQSLHQVFSCSCLFSAILKLPSQSGHLFLLFLQKMQSLFMICLQGCQLLLQITIFCNK